MSVNKLPPGLATRVERTRWPAARSLKTAVAIGPGTNPDLDGRPLAHPDTALAQVHLLTACHLVATPAKPRLDGGSR